MKSSRSRVLFVGVVALLAGQRLWEMRRSGRNETHLRQRGGREYGQGHFGMMKTLHSLWFLAMLMEVIYLRRPFRPLLAVLAAIVALVGQALRYLAIRSLGRRWTVRVITVPGERPIRRGIYRYLRHPNYLGVMLEIAAVPLLHTGYLTSIGFSIANALLLRTRIRIEEQALNAHNQYERFFGGRSRFLPRRR